MSIYRFFTNFLVSITCLIFINISEGYSSEAIDIEDKKGGKKYFQWQEGVEALLKQLDFEEISEEQYSDVFGSMKKKWGDLSLYNAFFLSADFIENLNLKSLSKLTLINHKTLGNNLIQILEVGSPLLTHLSLENLPQLKKATGYFPNLTYLSLIGCAVLQEVSLPNSPLIERSFIRKSPMFTTLQLSNKNLLELDLRNNKIFSEEALQNLLMYHTALKTLRVNGCPKIHFSRIRNSSPYFAVTLLRGLRRSMILIIREILHNSSTFISFYESYIGDSGAKALAEALKKNFVARSLNLYGNGIGEAGIKALCEAFNQNSTLTSIDLASNSIGAVGAIELIEGIKNNCALTSISLRHNKIGHLGIQALVVNLKANLTLTSINFRSNQIGNEGAKALAEVFENNTTLVSLNLGNNKIKAPGAQALAEALKKNKTITSINLEENNIGDVGFEALAEALEINTALTSINLRWSKMRDSGAKALGEALEKNSTLTLIDLGYNKIKNLGFKALTEALEINMALISINLEENNIGDMEK